MYMNLQHHFMSSSLFSLFTSSFSSPSSASSSRYYFHSNLWINHEISKIWNSSRKTNLETYLDWSSFLFFFSSFLRQRPEYSIVSLMMIARGVLAASIKNHLIRDSNRKITDENWTPEKNVIEKIKVEIFLFFSSFFSWNKENILWFYG